MDDYCMDSNFFIEFSKSHPVDLYQAFWDLLNELIEEKTIFIPKVVWDEISSNSTVSSSINKTGIIRDFTQETDTQMQKIMQDPTMQNMIDNKSLKNGADPFVIAYALAYNATLVANDGGVKEYCRKKEIKCIGRNDFLRELKVSFSVQRG